MRTWTICQSFHKDLPPSQWELNNYQQHCFKRHDTPPFETNDSTAPGTALFQRWIHDSYRNRNETSSSSIPRWDPWRDFPNEQILKSYPDISDGDHARDYYTQWYSTSVDVPNVDDHRGHLTLHGVNYQPIVYFGGKLLQPYSVHRDNDDVADPTGGMFVRRHYDLGLSNLYQTSSALEILVLPPPFVGRPCKEACTIKDCQGGDHNIAKSGAIMQCTAGWDWISPTPDRNTGIWDEVEIEWTQGDVQLHDVGVRISDIMVEYESDQYIKQTSLPLGDEITVSAWVNLTVTATYHANNGPIVGDFSYSVQPNSCQLQKLQEKLVSQPLVNGTIYNVTIQHNVAMYNLGMIHIPNAKLWWPHTHGSQPLYTVQVLFRSSNHTHESRVHTSFGVRTVSSETGAKSKSFTLKVNGHPIFLAGGNWITTDQFLRFSTSFQRYLDELTLMRKAGFNAIRIWGGGIRETRLFFLAADRIGMLIYQEFWMTGDNNGRFAGQYDWPNDRVSYIGNVKDVLWKLHNHPSLAFFGGGNELFPINESPPRDIEAVIKAHVDDVPYILSSVTEVGDSFDPLLSLAPKDGPYGIQKEETFFDRNPGFTSPLLSLDELAHNVTISDIKKKDSPGRNIGFQTEIGSVSHPELESLRRFLSSNALKLFPRCGATSCFQINEEWNNLKWLPFTEQNSRLDRICQFQYPPLDNLTSIIQMNSIEDYSWAAQFVQYNQYNALVQGYTHRIFNWHSAFFMWKTSSPSPTLRGSLYDWYLATNGGYWGMHSGLSGGSPVRLIFNQRDWTLHVVNASPVAYVGLKICWTAHSLNGTRVGGEKIALRSLLSGNNVVHLEYTVPWIQTEQVFISGVQNVLLYRMELFYSDQNHSSTHSQRHNYYLTDPIVGSNSQSRYAVLGALRKVVPKVKLAATCTIIDDIEMNIRCNIRHVQNMSVGVMIRFTLMLETSISGEVDNRVLPVFYSRNYVTLVPKESFDLRIDTTSEQKLNWTCLPDGYIGIATNKRGGYFLVLSTDGWNVEQKTVHIMCTPPLQIK